MKITRIATALALACAAGHASAAVTLNDNGVGQGLLFPFFTVHNGQTTLFSIHNTSNVGKALKVSTTESYFGYLTVAFNLYLPPKSTWNARLSPGVSPSVAAKLTIDDHACTVPVLAGGVVELLDYDYVEDAGPQGLQRTWEGAIEVIELGTLDAELTALAVADNCIAFNQRYSTGIWTTDANAGLSAPTGSLRGDAVIVDVADGTSFSYPALAFGGLASAPRQVPFAEPTPERLLFPRLTDIPGDDDVEVHVTRPDGTPVTLRYAPEQGYNAIGALLASRNADVGFNVETGVAARTEVVVAFPSRYGNLTDPAVVGVPEPGIPQHAPFSSGTSPCEPVPVTLYDDEGAPAAAQSVDICGEVDVVRIAAAGSTTAPIFARDNDPVVNATASSGTASFDFATAFGTNARRSAPDLDGNCWVGLPAWVYSISAYDNNNAQPGRIATFPQTRRASGTFDVVDCN